MKKSSRWTRVPLSSTSQSRPKEESFAWCAANKLKGEIERNVFEGTVPRLWPPCSFQLGDQCRVQYSSSLSSSLSRLHFLLMMILIQSIDAFQLRGITLLTIPSMPCSSVDHPATVPITPLWALQVRPLLSLPHLQTNQINQLGQADFPWAYLMQLSFRKHGLML